MQDDIKNSFEQILDKLSLLVIDIGQNDLRELADIHDCFTKIRGLQELPQKHLATIDSVMKTIEDVILEECPFQKGIEVIKKSITEIQNSFLGTAEKEKSRKGTPKKNKTKKENSEKLVDDEIISQFLQRQPSLLEEFEGKILEVEKGDNESEKEIRRYLHTWKGEAGVLDLTSLQQFIHNVESLIADNEGKDSGISIDGLFAVKDFLEIYFKSMESGKIQTVDKDKAEEIYSLFKGTNPSGSTEMSDNANEERIEQINAAAVKDETHKIDLSGDTSLICDFIAESQEHLHSAEVTLMNLETNPEDTECINALFRAFHTIKGVSSFVGLPEITDLSHKAETMLDRIRKGEVDLANVHIDLSFESVDMLKNMISSLQEALEGGEYVTPDGYKQLLAKVENPDSVKEENFAAPLAGKKVGEILVEAGRVTSESVEKAFELQRMGNTKPIGAILVDEGVAKPKEVVEALRAQKMGQSDKTPKIEQTVKVGTGRLDSLIDMVGELVIANSMVAQEEEIKVSDNHRLTRNVSHLGKIVRELQELTMSLRMVSVKATFQKMARLVRDLSKKNNKIVNFEMYGEDTELDRNVVEEIGDPLIHMVRNAVDHGIETPGERQQSGKPEYGTVKLNAYHKGGNVVIEISDDGKGLNRSKIIEKAIKMGIIKDAEGMDDQEIYNLIFHPGLSTAQKVSDISGRGVGMDVVKKNIEALRGHVDIKSKPGQGSTISLMLPLTLAIIDGMIIRVGKENFIMPTISVMESFRPALTQISEVAGKGKIIDLRGNHIPLYHLDAMFSIPDAVKNPCDGLVIVIAGTGDSKPRGFVVDELVGQQQVVIKSIGKGLGEIDGISGGAIMGDGKVGLILDPAGMVRVAESNTNIYN